jgi:anti-sigma28 factor (negative regulator of flagellin synthesis)
MQEGVVTRERTRIMNIQPILTGASAGKQVEETSRAKESRVSAASQVVDGAAADRVEISDEGRSMALAVGISSERSVGTPARQIEEIRARIQDGAYDSAEMAENVGSRILDSGDLRF